MDIETGVGPKVSVIMPIYNNEKFLRETLNSLKEQSFTDYEALCIDDGSKDDSARIIREFEASDNRFHYIFQENSGAGPARNHGLSLAKGEYISFLDGDDLYTPGFLKRMVDALEKTRADFCICEKDNFNSESGQSINKWYAYQKFEEGKAYQTNDLVDGYFKLMGAVCWNKVFRRSFVQKNSYEFQSIALCNDVAFVCSSISAAQTVCFVKEKLVRYRVGTGVSTQDKVVKYPLCALTAYDQARKNVYDRYKNDEAWQRSIDSKCADAFFNTISKVVNDDAACREVYNAFHSRYETEWLFREKPLRYFGNRRLRLRMWCYRRTSFEGMKKAYLKLKENRAKKRSFIDRAKPYVVLFVAGLFKR